MAGNTCPGRKNWAFVKMAELGPSLQRQFKTAIIWKLTFSPTGFQWAFYKKPTKIIRLHGLVTHVLHTQFTWNKKEM